MNTDAITNIIELYRRASQTNPWLTKFTVIANEADRQLKAIEAQVKVLMWNEELGCYTRQAFESIIWPEIADLALWIIFFDVDGMKELNLAKGWDQTSELIKRSLVMRSTDQVAGQVMSGDEFVVAVCRNPMRSEATDPAGLCQRIQESLREHGASATFAYSRVTSLLFRHNLLPVKSLVEVKKNAGERGTISFIDFPIGMQKGGEG